VIPGSQDCAGKLVLRVDELGVETFGTYHRKWAVAQSGGFGPRRPKMLDL
jgi:hypothetical protein